MTIFGDSALKEEIESKVGSQGWDTNPMLLGPHGNRRESQVLSPSLLYTEKAIGGHRKEGDKPEEKTFCTSIPNLLKPRENECELL